MRNSGCAFAFGLVLVSSTARGADYWVAPGGSDGANGAAATPWATLQHAADTAKPGDTVHVKDGDYVGFHVDNGGSQALPIVFVAEAAAAKITQRNAQTPDGINVENADWVTIDGFVTNGMPRAGVRCATSTHVTVRRIHADSNATWGIFSGFCDDLVVEDNVTSKSVAQHGIYVSNSAQRPIVRRNVIFDNTMCGLHMNGDASMGGVGTIDGALVERNVIYGNGKGGGSAINGDGVNGSIIRNNLVYATHASGISLYQIDASSPAKNNQIVHNTIVVASDGRWALNIVNGSTGNTAKYNILLNLNAGHGAFNMDAASLAGLVSDYNVVTPKFTADDGGSMLDLAGWRALGFDAHSIAGDAAVFANVGANDYQLAAGSSPIDKATGSTVLEDLAGRARPFGSASDIGCYEWGSTASASDAGLPVADASTPPKTDGAAGAGGAASGAGGGPGGAGGAAGAAIGGAGGALGGGSGGASGAGSGGTPSGGAAGVPTGGAAGASSGGTAGATAGGAQDAPAEQSSGCGCRVANAGARGAAAWLLLALAIVVRRLRAGN